MDLLQMDRKLDKFEYKEFNDFRNDFKLIVNNCRLYNGQNNGELWLYDDFLVCLCICRAT